MAFYTIQEAAELVGISYNRLWYALITNRLTETRRIGRLRLFDDYDIVTIRQYFAERDDSEEVSRE